MRYFTLLLGIFLFILVLAMPTPQSFIDTAREKISQENLARDVAYSMKATLALLLLMITWWITEAVPIPVTALLPGLLAPILGVVGVDDASGKFVNFDTRTIFVSYADRVIFLFLGGFLIAGAMQKWGLDRRLTLWILSRGKFANNTKLLLLAMMIITAFISMWISNTATTAMMLPIGLGIASNLKLKPGQSRYGTILLLGIAYSASIGGVGTLIGTIPNTIAVGILAKNNFYAPTFLDWMKVGIPYVVIFVPVAWFILINLFPPEISTVPGGKNQFREELRKLGRISRGELNTAMVFILAVVLWVTNPFWKYILPASVFSQFVWVDEYVIAIFCGIILFILPVSIKERKFTLEWKDTKFVDWGTLILFGGAIALSDMMFRTGFAGWLATSFVALFGKPSTLVLVFIIVLFMAFFTEITSNTAATSMMVPVLLAIAREGGQDAVSLAITAAMASSMAFMLPVATPPNALVYGTGFFRIKDMIKTGFCLEIVGWFLTVFIAYVFGYKVFGLFKF